MALKRLPFKVDMHRLADYEARTRTTMSIGLGKFSGFCLSCALELEADFRSTTSGTVPYRSQFNHQAGSLH